MIQEPLTLYKLIVLYMLNRVTFPLTTAQISDFVLDRDYTNFLTLQQIFNELADAGMISSHTIRNRTLLEITKDGKDTLHYFENRISDTIKNEIDSYFEANEVTLRDETSVLADYYKSTSGEYEAHLIAKEKEINLIELTLSVPIEEVAISICDNWQKKSQDIYKYLTDALF